MIIIIGGELACTNRGALLKADLVLGYFAADGVCFVRCILVEIDVDLESRVHRTCRVGRTDKGRTAIFWNKRSLGLAVVLSAVGSEHERLGNV